MGVGGRNKGNNFGLFLNYICVGRLFQGDSKKYWLRFTVTKLVPLEVFDDKTYGDMNVNRLHVLNLVS